MYGTNWGVIGNMFKKTLGTWGEHVMNPLGMLWGNVLNLQPKDLAQINKAIISPNHQKKQ
jgi:hypothetical protein